MTEYCYTMDDLLYLMDRLRDPDNGCPWDLHQTEASLVNYSIEEVYELADAIESGNSQDICGELGDVLFQVVFFARLAAERGDFQFTDIIHGLCQKLVLRHPHVFPDGELRSDPPLPREAVAMRQVADNWEAIKLSERAARQRTGLFADVPLALPASLRAAKLQKRATAVGMDWPSVGGALACLESEICELHDELSTPIIDRQRLEAELGDIFFSCVNVARKLDINPEQALRGANQRFVARVTAACQLAENDNITLADTDETARETYWQRAKAIAADG